MMWNHTKFQALRMGPNRTLIQDTTLFSPGYEDPIEEQEATKDLGILVDCEATFNAHRAAVVAKTARKAAWVLRTFRTRDMGLLRTLWKSLVRPHQDYGSQLWSPVGAPGALMAQEGPQRAFTKRMGGLTNLHYWEWLQRAKLLSTE